jgi:hypothetical protein
MPLWLLSLFQLVTYSMVPKPYQIGGQVGLDPQPREEVSTCSPSGQRHAVYLARFGPAARAEKRAGMCSPSDSALKRQRRILFNEFARRVGCQGIELSEDEEMYEGETVMESEADKGIVEPSLSGRNQLEWKVDSDDWSRRFALERYQPSLSRDMALAPGTGSGNRAVERRIQPALFPFSDDRPITLHDTSNEDNNHIPLERPRFRRPTAAMDPLLLERIPVVPNTDRTTRPRSESH